MTGMKQYLILLAIMLFSSALAFSQTDRNTRYVAVQNADLKDSTGFFSKDVGKVSLGDAVTLVREDGKWSQIRAGNVTGWVSSSNLSSRRVVSSSSSAITANEVALAGKGFSPAMETEYKKSGLDFSLVDAMERTTVPAGDLLTFINEGRLAKGE